MVLNFRHWPRACQAPSGARKPTQRAAKLPSTFGRVAVLLWRIRQVLNAQRVTASLLSLSGCAIVERPHGRTLDGNFAARCVGLRAPDGAWHVLGQCLKFRTTRSSAPSAASRRVVQQQMLLGDDVVHTPTRSTQRTYRRAVDVLASHSHSQRGLAASNRRCGGLTFVANTTLSHVGRGRPPRGSGGESRSYGCLQRQVRSFDPRDSLRTGQLAVRLGVSCDRSSERSGSAASRRGTRPTHAQPARASTAATLAPGRVTCHYALVTRKFVLQIARASAAGQGEPRHQSLPVSSSAAHTGRRVCRTSVLSCAQELNHQMDMKRLVTHAGYVSRHSLLGLPDVAVMP